MSFKSFTTFILLSLVLASCKSNESQSQIISVREYEDKLKAAWIGQMVGVGWAAITEYKWIGEIIPKEEVPEWTPDMVNQYGQDDLYVEMNFMESMEKYGSDVCIRRAGIDFANTDFGLAAANDRARENLRAGIAPPASSHPRFNVNCEDIDYQIEADYSGIIAPGMPQVPISLGEKFGRLMNYGDGMYAGQFIGGMYSAAYFESDIETIIKKGLACIPDSSQYTSCIMDVINWYHEDPINWKGTWRKIVDKYYNTLDYQPFHRVNPKAWAGIDAKLNGAFVVLGLLYGRGDIDSTFYISVRSGFDSDCNPSSALGILFTSKGLDNIPEKYYSALDETKIFSSTHYTFPKLIEASKKLTKSFMDEYGGKIEKGSDDQEYLIIPMPKPVPSKLARSWNPEPLDESSIYYTDAEMKEIKFLPSCAFDSILQIFAPGWLISNCTTEATPKLISLRGRDNVLQMAFIENGSCNIRHELLVPETKNPKLKLSVLNEPGKTWTLKILFNWQPVYTIEVNDTLTKDGWFDIIQDLSEYKGKKLFILLNGSEGSGNDSKVFLNNLTIQ
ncbi:MAG: ADP-ribosylglycohydrolase family protein [Bacteroidales bacterium]|nr:ADP-ribosylglycohydrolase family protein [Bacteroidales bacterium]